MSWLAKGFADLSHSFNKKKPLHPAGVSGFFKFSFKLLQKVNVNVLPALTLSDQTELVLRLFLMFPVSIRVGFYLFYFLS